MEAKLWGQELCEASCELSELQQHDELRDYDYNNYDNYNYRGTCCMEGRKRFMPLNRKWSREY
jgi:hypothetical protein